MRHEVPGDPVTALAGDVAARERDVESLKAPQARLVAEGRQHDAAAGELIEVLERQLTVLRDTHAIERELAAIRASTSWRALELFRTARLRLQRARLAARRLGASGWPRRARSVPESVRRGPLGVNVSGYIAAESGMGEAVRSTIRALELAGVPVALDNIPSSQRAHDGSFTAFAGEHPHPFNVVHLNADNMETFARAKGRRYFRDRYTIGFWFWELAQFRRDWSSAFRFVQEVWVASRFTQACLEAVSPVPVIYMPPGLVTPEPLPVGRAHFGIPAHRFVFLFVFDVSSQTERKNPLAVIRAFRQAGFAHDDAMLVLKFTNASHDRAGVRRLYQEANGLNVLMLDGFMDRHELSALLNAADAYVSLHRSEGFGLTIAEAMALGKPVIATGYSSNMEFMTPGNSFAVDYLLTTLSRNHGPYPRGFTWADPDVDHAARLMRTLVDDSRQAAEAGRQAAADVRAQFSPAGAAARIRGRLEEISSEAPR